MSEGTEIRRIYLDDHAHNGQRQDSPRVRRRPAIDVIASCWEDKQCSNQTLFNRLKQVNTPGMERAVLPGHTCFKTFLHLFTNKFLLQTTDRGDFFL